jgi:hypothetical protein
MIYRYFKVAHRDMVYLKFILEAYEGMNVMSTVDNKAGIIRIAIPHGFEADMDGLLASLGQKIVMEAVEWKGEDTLFKTLMTIGRLFS